MVERLFGELRGEMAILARGLRPEPNELLPFRVHEAPFRNRDWTCGATLWPSPS